MNASAVKPALPTGGVQAPKVGLGAPPPAANNSPTAANVSPPKMSGLPNTSGSPAKPPVTVNINHVPIAAMPLPLSLVQEHKPPAVAVAQQQPALGLLRPEKKEYPFASAPLVKPTSNGVEGSPNKSTPLLPAPAQPLEVKKPEEEPAALPIQNHTVEPVKLAVPHPAVVPPPAPQPAAPLLEAQPLLSSPPKIEPVIAVTNNHSNKTEVTSETKPVLQETPPAVPSLSIAPAEPPPVSVAPPAPVAAPETVAKPAPTSEPPKTRPEVVKAEFKVATPPRNNKRKKEAKVVDEGKASTSDEDDRKSKRTRTRTQPFQSPNPELIFIAKTIKTLSKSPDDKLIVFYKNEFLAVRNSEGSFYVCQTMQNIYKSSLKIRILWLSQKEIDAPDVYSYDFTDHTDFDCILTNLELKKIDKKRFQLPPVERERTQNILKRALDVEKGVSEKSPLTEEHPDGLDLSLFRDESQLKKRKRGSKRSGKKRTGVGSETGSEEEDKSDEGSSDESSEDDEKKPIAKPSAKKAEKPRAPVKTKEVDKRAERLSEREKRGSTSKRRNEPIPLAATPVGRTTRPPPEKKAKVAVAKPTKKVEAVPESSVPTRSAKTRSKKAVIPVKSLPATRTKEREPRKVATPPVAKGRKKPGKKA